MSPSTRSLLATVTIGILVAITLMTITLAITELIIR